MPGLVPGIHVFERWMIPGIGLPGFRNQIYRPP